MIWSLETDDFLGKCNGEKYPLLSTINRVLLGDVKVSSITHSTLIRKIVSNHYECKNFTNFFFVCSPLQFLST
jgi:hypothetical protein